MGKFVNLEKLGYDSYDGIVVASYTQYSPEHNNLGRIAVTVSFLGEDRAQVETRIQPEGTDIEFVEMLHFSDYEVRGKNCDHFAIIAEDRLDNLVAMMSTFAVKGQGA